VRLWDWPGAVSAQCWCARTSVCVHARGRTCECVHAYVSVRVCVCAQSDFEWLFGPRLPTESSPLLAAAVAGAELRSTDQMFISSLLLHRLRTASRLDPCHIGTQTGLAPSNICARPHLHRDSAHPATSAPGLALQRRAATHGRSGRRRWACQVSAAALSHCTHAAVHRAAHPARPAGLRLPAPSARTFSDRTWGFAQASVQHSCACGH